MLNIMKWSLTVSGLFYKYAGHENAWAVWLTGFFIIHLITIWSLGGFWAVVTTALVAAMLDGLIFWYICYTVDQNFGMLWVGAREWFSRHYANDWED